MPKRMKTDHLTAILGCVELGDDSTISSLLNEQINVVFQTRQDVPDHRNANDKADYEIFSKTAIFAVKLKQLEMQSASSTQQADETEKKTDQSLSNLLAEAEKIIGYNNTEVQVRLLQLLVNIREHSSHNNYLQKTLKNLFYKVIQDISTSEMSFAGIESHRLLIQLIEDSGIKVKEWQRSFIEAIKKSFSEIHDYIGQYFYLSKSIYPCWEKLQEYLKLEDIQWLKKQRDDLEFNYKNLPTRGAKMLGRYAPLFDNIIAGFRRNMGWLLPSVVVPLAAYRYFIYWSLLLKQELLQVRESFEKANILLHSKQDMLNQLLTAQAEATRQVSEGTAQYEELQAKYQQLPDFFRRQFETMMNTLQQKIAGMQNQLAEAHHQIADMQVASKQQQIADIQAQQMSLEADIQRGSSNIEAGVDNKLLWTSGIIFFAVAASATGYAAYRFLTSSGVPKPPALPAWVTEREKSLNENQSQPRFRH